MKRYLQIAAFTLGVSLLYTAVGQVLPQLESHPPARLDRLPSDVGPDVLAEMGEGVFASSCAQCHTISAAGGRGPDLAGIGSRAAGGATAGSATPGTRHCGGEQEQGAWHERSRAGSVEDGVMDPVPDGPELLPGRLSVHDRPHHARR